jgi:DNA-binding FadR family transcriptional regulator
MNSVHVGRLYARIADQVVALMHERGLGPGARLPPEGELARELGVSRLAVREAMVAMETAGLVVVRSGDGTFVLRRPRRGARLPWARKGDPGPGPLEQLAARRVLEPALAERAAFAAAPEQLDALEALAREISATVDAGLPVEDQQVDFHALLAEASGVTLLAALVPELMAARAAGGSPMWHTLRQRSEAKAYLRTGVTFRAALVAALRRRDGTAARRLVERHLDAMEAILAGAEAEQTADGPA